MQHLETQVCIIGGSIAGNLLAYYLRQKNISCIVIEEHTVLGQPCHCAGIVAQKIMTMLDFPPELILNRVKYAKIVTPNLMAITMHGT